MIGSVASESFNLEPFQLVNAVFGESKAAVMETVAALEAASGGVMDLEKDSQRFIVGRMIEIRLAANGSLTTTTSNVKDGISVKNNQKYQNVAGYDIHGNPVMGNIPNGGSLDTGIDHSNARTTQTSEQIQEFTAYIYVQLIPRILTTDTSRLMLDIQYVPTLSERWRKYRAGEISFWKDFVFARDLIDKQHQALKNDRTGTVGQIVSKSRGKLAQYFFGLASLRTPSHNLASAISIISKDAFDRACKENNIDFGNIKMRNNYFNRTFTMMMVVVDTMYGKVDIYYNGVDYVGTYTFDMVNRVGAKGKDNFNLKEVMTAFSQGMSPRF